MDGKEGSEESCFSHLEKEGGKANTDKLVVVGFGMAKNEYMLSRLMAFDAEIIGTWGCLPEYYPIVITQLC